MRGIRLKLGIGLATAVVLASSCSGTTGSSTTTTAEATTTSAPPTTTQVDATTTSAPPTTTVPPATTTAPTPPLIDEPFLAGQVAKSWDSSKPGAVMISVFDPGGGSVWASVGTDDAGTSPTPDDAIRIGSVTKMFTATVVMSLVADGLVDLDASVRDYVSRVDVESQVTVRDLLQHSSGIPDYVGGGEYLAALIDDPTRTWLPEEVIALAPPTDLDFEPGSSYAYSNTNYIVLGVLIEEVTGQPYHEIVRERILDPLNMASTYLESYEDGPDPFAGYTGLFGSIDPVTFDFTSIATNEWSAGGLVSNGQDLHTMLTAFFAGEIVPEELVTEMTQNTDWGFGFFAPEWSSDTPLLGHDGRTVGSGTFVIHAPDTGVTVFTFANADHLKVSPATGAVAEAIGVPGVELVTGS